MNHTLCFVLAAVLLTTSSALWAKQPREDREPEAATGYVDKQAFTAEEFMVVAANPYASWAGKKIIEAGGGAIDAAVAIQAMLTLVEPQSSGIGGGTFILYWDNTTKTLHTFDGREMAPEKVTSDLFMHKNKPVPWREAIQGGRAVGAPGAVRALDMAHKEFGKLPWQALFKDSIDTAREGFTVSPRLEKLVSLKLHPGLELFGETKRYFHPKGEPLKAGYVLKNTAYANVLEKIAERGADYFYDSELSQKIVNKVQKSIVNPGALSLDDLKGYEAKKRAPVCGTYKAYEICGMAPPSSGGLTVLQVMKMLEHHDLAKYQPNQLEALHVFTQATKLAYADRRMYMADTDFTKLPISALISDSYLRERSGLINADKDMGRARWGQPYTDRQFLAMQSYELPNTTHLSIVDKEGNVVSMTSSIEMAFGSGLMVEGFLLNNQMTDFAFNPSYAGRTALNRVEPKKRPLSSMTPTMVFNADGEPILAIGSPGGTRIISYVAQTLIGVLDWGLDIQQAINLPKVTNRNDYTALEAGTPVADLQSSFEKLGHQIKVRDLNSGLHGIQILPGKLVGGADPRREGVAVGR